MPFYEYECPNGHIEERMRPMRERQDSVRCDLCRRKAKLIISQTYFTNPTRDKRDLARSGIWSPNIMDGDVDRLKANRDRELNPRRGEKGHHRVRVRELGDAHYTRLPRPGTRI